MFSKYSEISSRLHPLLAFACSLPIFLAGLPAAVSPLGWLYPLGIGLLFVCFGYGKTWLKFSLFGIPVIAVASALTLISFPPLRALQNGFRSYFLLMGGVLTLTINPMDLVRVLNSLKLPRVIGIGLLVTLRFFTVIAQEMRRIHLAMQSRGLRSVFRQPRLLYRAFLMPLVMRLFSLSDILAVSLETRGFHTEGSSSTYRDVRWRLRDSLFLASFLLVMGGSLYVTAFR